MISIPSESSISNPATSTWFAYRVSLIAAMGGFLFGFETAVISGAEQTIQNLWSLDAFWQGFTVASSLIGTVIGTLIIGQPAQIWGRKKVLMTIALLYLASAFGCTLAEEWLIFVGFRVLGGIAVGASSVVGPMYISEIAPPAIRGRLTGSFQINIVLGILVAYVLNALFSDFGSGAWRWMFGSMAFPSAFFFGLLFTIPESPRWLITQGKNALAETIFAKTGEKIMQATSSQTLDIPKNKLFSSKFSKPVFFAIALAMFNQLSGINAIIYYAPRIFEMAGYEKSDSFIQSIYIGLANLGFTLLAMTMIDRFGRKTLLLIGSLGMTAFLALCAPVFLPDYQSDGTIVLLYLIGYIAFFAFSQGAVIWVFISEIFPNSVRAQGAALGSFTHWIMAVLVSWIFPIVVQNYAKGSFYAFLFFASMMVVQLLFIVFFLPETKGKSLEQIEGEMLKS
jgi:sugar porter (SP) family MFS transporter